MIPGLVKKIAIPGIVLVLAGGAAAQLFKPSPKKDKITYETGKAEVGNVKSFVSATGIIQPWKTVDVKSNVAGKILKLAVDLGDTVKTGQLIALIDPTDTRTAKEQADADYQAAMARQRQADANWKQQKEQGKARVAAANHAIKSAEARFAEAQANSTAQPSLTTFSIAQAQASLVSAQKAVSQAENGKQQLEEALSTLKEVTIPLNVRTVESTVDQAKANMDTAQSEYKRQASLMSQGYVAKSDVESAFARLASAKATAETARQRKQTLQRENQLSVKELQARINEADGRIDEARSRVVQAQAALDLAKTNSFQNTVRQKEVESAQAAVEQAKAELTSAEADLRQIDVRAQEILAAGAQIVRSEAAIKQANTNLGYTRIEAPRDGVIIAKNVEEGTVVPSSRASIGSTNALLQIGDVSKLWIVCNVDETDISQVSVGQEVSVSVDAYPSLNGMVDGKVIRIDPQAKVEQNVTYIPVTVEIQEPDPRFKPLMNATCEFITQKADNVLLVPNEAVHETEGQYSVEKMVAGKPVKVDVQVGIAGQDSTEIKSGLQEGDEVVTKTIKPEAEQAGQNNPFNPFGGMGNRRGGAGGGAGGGGGGNRPGGGGGGGGNRGGR
jgi:HlyD family secretion protein